MLSDNENKTLKMTALKPRSVIHIPESREVPVWDLASPAIYPSNFCGVEARARNVNLNVVVCETYKKEVSPRK